jgi:hypothetical protein
MMPLVPLTMPPKEESREKTTNIGHDSNSGKVDL